MKIKRVSDAVSRKFRMRICHESDTHGGFQRLHGRYDAVLHTGDFFPNSHHVALDDKVGEAAFQMNWLKDHVSDLKQQLRGHPFLFVLGNHDFADPDLVEKFLRSVGINAINLTNKMVSYGNVNFYGFPYVPFISGGWNYEKHVPEMQAEVDQMVNILNTTYVDVLACHSAIYQCLDLSYGNLILGSTVIANALDYKISKDMMPMAYLHGHIHESHGLAMRNGMLVSNAAVTYQIIEV